jgi:hypothetical protein
MKNHSIYSICFLISLIVILASCEKNKCDKRDIYYNVSDERKNMIPYTGYDTLTFIRTSLGDTHTFIGNGKKITYDIQVETAECGNTLYYEKYFYTYNSKTYNSSLIIGQYTNNNNTEAGETYIDFQNQIFNGSVNFNFVKPNLDSLKVLNNVYKKIEIIPDNKSYAAYFNKEYGCIKLVFTNGDTWELLNLKK